MRLPVTGTLATLTPSLPLARMMLAAPETVPPTVLLLPLIDTPSPWLEEMMLPSTLLPEELVLTPSSRLPNMRLRAAGVVPPRWCYCHRDRHRLCFPGPSRPNCR